MGSNAQEKRFRKLTLRYFRNWKEYCFGGLFASGEKADQNMKARGYDPNITTFEPCILETMEIEKQARPKRTIRAKVYIPPPGKKPAIATFKIKKPH